MSRTRRLALLGATLLLTTTALLLSRWQLQRLRQRRESNSALLAARALPPLDLTDSSVAPVPGRRLRVHGEFGRGQFALRGRVHDVAPGLEVVTAFRVAGSEATLWVVRGFVGSPDATTLPQFPQPTAGEVTIEGLALPIPITADAGQPLVRGRDTTWRRLDRAVIHQRTPATYDVYLLLIGEPAGPGQLPPVGPPVLDDGPHLSYALQWFGIALAIAAFGIISLRRGDPGSVPPRAAP
ncbi:MAG: SURF1 family protein [Gemmatimonadales bacterium]